MVGQRRGEEAATGLDWIRDAARRRPPGSRGNSPLYWWVWDHHEALAELLPPRPYWDGIAAGLIERHRGDEAKLIEDGEGKPPTGERLRKVFWAVGRDKRRLPRKGRGAGAPVAAEPAAVPVPAEAPPAPTVRREGSGQAPAHSADDGLGFLRFAGGRKT